MPDIFWKSIPIPQFCYIDFKVPFNLFNDWPDYWVELLTISKSENESLYLLDSYIYFDNEMARVNFNDVYPNNDFQFRFQERSKGIVLYGHGSKKSSSLGEIKGARAHTTPFGDRLETSKVGDILYINYIRFKLK